MKEKISLINPLQIIGNIILIFIVILLFIVNNDIISEFYWMTISLILLSNVYFISKWTKPGIDLDNNKSKNETRNLGDMLILMLVIYCLTYFGVMLIDCYYLIISNQIFMVGYALFTLVIELFGFVIIGNYYDNVKKQIKK